MVSGSETYCRHCGSVLDTRLIEGRRRAYCPACETVQYRNPTPCAGTLVVDDDAILLVQRTNPPAAGSWSVPAGYLEHDEPPEEAAVRELAEETGVRVAADAVDLFESVFVAHQERHVLVLVYVVRRAATSGTPRPGSDAADATFWAYDDLTPSAPLEPGYRAVFRRAVEEYGELD